MYDDLRLVSGNERINYDIEYGSEVKICCNNIHISKLKIYYDNNIYDIVLNNDMKVIKDNEIDVTINKGNCSFILELKDNYFVKTVYKYVNELIKENELNNEIDLFIRYGNSKYKNDLENLLGMIKEKEDVGNSFSKYCNEYIDIKDILLNNNSYQVIVDKMSIHDLMLLITWYLSVEYPPSIDQDMFHLIVEDAICSEDSLENVWRIAMNYDERGFDFSLIDKFFIESHNAYYLSEYISGVLQVNQEKLVDMLICDGDKEFIRDFLDKYIGASNLDSQYVQMLKEYV